MNLGRRYTNDSRLVHHHLFVFDGAAAVTSVGFTMDNFVVGVGSLNPCFPSAAKLVSIGLHTLCFADTVPGNWTLRVRKNEGATDEATFAFALTNSFSKSAGSANAEPVFQAGDTYHVLADGPEKNTVVLRLTLEWEVL